MKTTAHGICRIALVMLLTLLSIGCSRPKQPTLIGMWHSKVDNACYEFNEDGTLTLAFEAFWLSGNKPANGKWMILSDGKVKIDADVYGNPISKVFLLNLSENEMVFTETNGSASYHHKRVIVEQGVAVYAPQGGASTEP